MGGKMTVNPHSSSSPLVFSSDAAIKLEQAIKFMVRSFLDDGLLERGEIINLLEAITMSIGEETEKPQDPPAF